MSLSLFDAASDAAAGAPSSPAAGLPPRRRTPSIPRPSLLLAAAFLLFLLASCLVPHLVSGGDPFRIAPRHAFAAPSFAHPFGTDQSGRDILARVVFGTRQSLLIGTGATAVAMGIAIVLALVGGLGGRPAEAAVQWLFQVLFSFPVLMLALLFAAAFGHGIVPLLLATGLAGAAGYGRMVLAQVLSVRHAPYVEAARVLGHSPLAIIRRHVLPNAMRPLVVVATMGVGQNIVWSAALS
ncbi:MAG: ABC transporter permease, partial [Gluconacetobacter diazotrophicus]|nr:ABC transporter permease [Gluconacetobacter diazotrophicus]